MGIATARGAYCVLKTAVPMAMGRAINDANALESTVPKARAAMPNVFDPSGSHFAVLRNDAWSVVNAGIARAIRKTAIAPSRARTSRPPAVVVHR